MHPYPNFSAAKLGGIRSTPFFFPLPAKLAGDEKI
jgi:hypothetical protein